MAFIIAPAPAIVLGITLAAHANGLPDPTTQSQLAKESMSEIDIREQLSDIKAELGMLQSQITRLTVTVDSITVILHGTGEKLGITQRIAILWRSWVWVACTASGLVGSVLTYLVFRMIGFKP